MDVTTLMHNLKEEVTCSVCIQPYTIPKQLPCLHIFCLQCLNKVARANAHDGKIKCPLCQREVAVPESCSLETLPNCFHMKNLLDILAIKECNTTKVTCGNCEKTSVDAISYCFHCGKFWCNDCLNGHNILRENRDHRVLALKDFQDKDFEDVLKRPVFCQRELHGNEIIKFYCKECDIPVCQTCVIVEHNRHDVEHLEVAAREVKRSLASKLDIAKKSMETIGNFIRELEEKSLLLEHLSQINKERIQQIVNSLIETLKRKGQESIAEVENQRIEAQEQINRRKYDFQDQFNRWEQSISQIEALAQCNTGVELVRTKAIFDDKFQGLQSQQPQNIPMSERKIPTTVFLRNHELFKIIKESRVGHLNQSQTEAIKCLVQGLKATTAGLETEMEVITRDSKGRQYYCPTDYITVQLSSAQDLSLNCIADKVKITDKENGCYTISLIPNQPGKHILTVQVNGENVQEFPPIDVKERSFTSLRTIGEGAATEDTKLKYPWGVTVTDSGEFVVSDKDNNRIVVFSEKGELLRSFGQNFLNCPNGLCIDKTGRIIVGNRIDNKIFLFEEDGECVVEIHNGSSLKKPRGISFDAQGNLVVCDTGNKCVTFFSPEGRILKSIGKDKLEMPACCLCFEDKIFVSDHKDHSIKVFHIDGRFLYKFGSYGNSNWDLNRPSGLALDKTGHLLVCSFSNHKVQVFTLDGKFVTQFGELGKEMGQMYSPSAVSVLQSGHIVVCEQGNCRLQIFE